MTLRLATLAHGVRYLLPAVGLAVACGERPRPAASPSAAAAVDAGGDHGDLEPDRPSLPEVPEDERIAAIERAMNQLAPVAHQCWAAAAADDFRLVGDLRALITVGAQAGPGATVAITADTADDPTLARCLVAVLGAYAWPPPLAGQVVELPFHFAAPAMQNVIDRSFVPHRQQAGVDVAVLLDEANTGNPALSLIEVSAPATTKLGPREVERLEVWAFSAAARVVSAGGGERALVAGDVMIAPVGARLEVSGAAGGELHAIVALVPGGREGAARAGALPGRATTMAVRARPVQPLFVTAAAARTYPRPGGATTILVEPPAAKGAISIGLLEIDAGVKVPLHVHARETEALYLIAGGGTMTVAGTAVPVTRTSVVQVPAGVEHGFEAAAATRAIQLYTPAGPEQRFKKP